MATTTTLPFPKRRRRRPPDTHVCTCGGKVDLSNTPVSRWSILEAMLYARHQGPGHELVVQRTLNDNGEQVLELKRCESCGGPASVELDDGSWWCESCDSAAANLGYDQQAAGDG